jgi:hypothetical protein
MYSGSITYKYLAEFIMYTGLQNYNKEFCIFTKCDTHPETKTSVRSANDVSIALVDITHFNHTRVQTDSANE